MAFEFDFGPGFRANYQRTKLKDMYRDATISDHNQLTIKIPDRRILRVIARSVLLFLVIASFPWIGSIIGSSNGNSSVDRERSQPPIDDLIFLPLLFQDLANLGLINPGDRALLIGKADRQRLQILKDVDIDLVSESDAQRQRSVHDHTLDFVFASGFANAAFIDRTLKIGGIVAVRLTGYPSDAFRVPLNFKIVYLRQFDATVVAMRKVAEADAAPAMRRRRRLLAIPPYKMAVLEGLEDVLLEPPRVASAQSHRRYRRRTRYLPDLMGDSLDKYPRRVFIDVGSPGKSGGTRWFERYYPTRKRTFEMYQLETVTSESAAAMEMSEWLRCNVAEDEYVVMKAEAEVVEEILSKKAIWLVDELFMECKHEGQNEKKREKSRRAYWECLALYGKLRDEGVAVHQWWG